MKVSVQNALVLLASCSRAAEACYGYYVNSCFDVKRNSTSEVDCSQYYMSGTNFGYLGCQNGTDSCKEGSISCSDSQCEGSASPDNDCSHVNLTNTTRCSDYYQQYSEKGGGQCMVNKTDPSFCVEDPMSSCYIDPNLCYGPEAPGGKCTLVKLPQRHNQYACSQYYEPSYNGKANWCMEPEGPSRSQCVTDPDNGCDMAVSSKTSNSSIFANADKNRPFQPSSLRARLS